MTASGNLGTSVETKKRNYTSFRPVALPKNLRDLDANLSGVIELPTSLDWSPDKRFNLDIPRQEQHFYQRVLNEAADTSELAQYINAARLLELWPRLRPAHYVREAWEKRFPELLAA